MLRNVRTYRKNGEIEIWFELVRMYAAFYQYLFFIGNDSISKTVYFREFGFWGIENSKTFDLSAKWLHYLVLH